ncbi:hypothetical protein HPB50_010132 [Hyalomma asiaticum]|uniref:Uncharacterized protein n=1 Tax=Hyalomma asiaticum TaxID=266040 RepID=A0ACB7TFU9_HYAAI|nr:hypothetical protein HPB50_010132 [Hyalomma asiaticum]
MKQTTMTTSSSSSSSEGKQKQEQKAEKKNERHSCCLVRSVMGPGRADISASSRGNRRSSTEDTEYQVILPRLPTVFLHGDVRVRPFRLGDFRDAFEEVCLLPAVVALGAYPINHVWAVTLNSGEATKRLTALKELLVKGRRCLVIDKQEQQVKIRLHWLLHGVADEDVRTALAAFGKVTEKAKGDKFYSSRHLNTATVPMKPQQHLRAGQTVEEKAQAVKVSKTLTSLRKTPP